MADRSLQGTGLGAKSFEDEAGVEFAARQEVGFDCPREHHFTLVFAAEAEIPALWECPRCGGESLRSDGERPEPRKRSRCVRTGTCCASAAPSPSSRTCWPSGWTCSAPVSWARPRSGSRDTCRSTKKTAWLLAATRALDRRLMRFRHRAGRAHPAIRSRSLPDLASVGGSSISPAMTRTSGRGSSAAPTVSPSIRSSRRPAPPIETPNLLHPTGDEEGQQLPGQRSGERQQEQEAEHVGDEARHHQQHPADQDQRRVGQLAGSASCRCAKASFSAFQARPPSWRISQAPSRASRPGWRASARRRSAGRPGPAARPPGTVRRPAPRSAPAAASPRLQPHAGHLRRSVQQPSRSCRARCPIPHQVVRTRASATIFWLILESPYSRSTKVIGTSTTR